MKAYQPIDCNMYDYIEHFAVLRKEVLIRYLDLEASKEQQLRTKITDTQVKNGEEFMLLANGLRIRLDHLLGIDNIDFTEGSSCKIDKQL